MHASSASWVSTIGTATRLHPDWGNVLADNYGIPFITVTGSQPLVPIVPDPNFGYSDESDPGPCPIPPNAPIEDGPSGTGDRHAIVVEPPTAGSMSCSTQPLSAEERVGRRARTRSTT